MRLLMTEFLDNSSRKRSILERTDIKLSRSVLYFSYRFLSLARAYSTSILYSGSIIGSVVALSERFSLYLEFLVSYIYSRNRL
jgi:hypothetical protein